MCNKKFMLLTGSDGSKFVLSTDYIDYIDEIYENHENYKKGLRSIIFIKPNSIYTDNDTYLNSVKCKETPQQIYNQLKRL